MPVDLTTLNLHDVPPVLILLAAAMGLALMASFALMFGGGGERRKSKDAADLARGLQTELKSLKAERDDLKNEHSLANQNVQFFYANMGLDSFKSDEEKKRFIDAVGAFARNGDVEQLLRTRDVDLTQALGMSSAELSDLMTFRNHIDAEWIKQPAKAAKSLDHLAARLQAIAAMETVWRDKSAHISDIRKILADNLWVFEPDYIVSKNRVWVDRAISTIAGGAEDGSGKRPDVFAITALSASLQSGHQWRDIHRTGALLIDLKSPSTRIGAQEIQSGSMYAREVLKAGIVKGSMTLDCYVVGKDVDEDEGAPRLEGWSGNVRVIPVSYDQLIARAKRMTMDLVRLLSQTPARFEDKVHAMPEAAAAADMDAAEASDEHVHDEQLEHAESGDNGQDELAQDEFGQDVSAHDDNDHHDGDDVRASLRDEERDAHDDAVSAAPEEPLPAKARDPHIGTAPAVSGERRSAAFRSARRAAAE